MRAVIVEDESDAINLLSTMISEFIPDLELIGNASNVQDAVHLIRTKRPELVFLDINLDDGNGFDVLDKLTEENLRVIFTTAYDDYAIKAFRYNAVDYLLKPFSVSDLVEAVAKAKTMEAGENIHARLSTLIAQIRDQESGKIPFYTAEGINIYHIERILRLEADRSYCVLYLTDGKKIMISRPLKEIEEILPGEIFFRIHKSHLINKIHVHSYLKDDGGWVELINQVRLPVSRRKKEAFLEFLADQ